MGDYLDYLFWRGDLTFDQVPFNEVDSAILAEMSYFPFDVLNIGAHIRSSMAESLSGMLLLPDLKKLAKSEEDISLMKALSESRRFRNLPILEFRNIFDESHVVQFAVITIQLAPELYYVSYRGTDSTLIGWQEDFNIGVAFPVPSQRLAAIYLNNLAEKTAGNFILGGHSKGGNLAVYAGAFCNQEIQHRIAAIYNFDGPGFESWVMSQPEYLKIADKIVTMVPQSSIIGMLLEQADGYQVVHSVNSGGLAQHVMISWEVERDHFVKLESVTAKSRFLDSTITGWINGMTYEQRRIFVESLFCVLKDANVSIKEISVKKIRQMLSMVKSYAGMDTEMRSHISSSILALIRCAREEAPAFGMGGFRMFREK